MTRTVQSSGDEPPEDDRIDAAFVERWASRYPLADQEVHLFAEVGPTVRRRGHYLREELVQVCRWKSPRSRSYVARNADEDIEELTRLALSAPERLRHRILLLLAGVQTPMASALLTVACPDEHTVIDYRALETLRAYGEIDEDWPGYVSYLQICRRLAHDAGTDLRRLDRALWTWSKEQGS